MSRRKVVKRTAPPAGPQEAGFLVALQENAQDTATRAAYADWLDEQDRAYEAAVQRDKAGLSEVWYKLRRKTDGLFADPDGPELWTKSGKRWRTLKHLVPHVTNVSRGGRYLGVKWEELEAVVAEIRPVDVGTLPVLVRRPYPRWPSAIRFAIDEPVTPSLPQGLSEEPAEGPPPSQSGTSSKRRR